MIVCLPSWIDKKTRFFFNMAISLVFNMVHTRSIRSTGFEHCASKKGKLGNIVLMQACPPKVANKKTLFRNISLQGNSFAGYCISLHGVIKLIVG